LVVSAFWRPRTQTLQIARTLFSRTSAVTTFPPPLRVIKTGTARQPMEAAMAWIALVLAGIFEIVWASAMKQSHGFSRLWPSVLTIGGMIVSFGLLAWSMRSLPLGTAYTIWTGIGAVGAFLIGVLVFGEAASALRILAAFLILSGLVLMKLATA
jgi:quaternary ammonium compound-resistance protein SugE